MAGAVAKKTVDGVRVPGRAEMKKLVAAHSKLDEPMTAAIWIFQDGPAPWLVEVLPELPDDPGAAQPLVFGPGSEFRYSLPLVSGNERSLAAALKKDKKLAQAVASGEILHEKGGVGTKLVTLAKKGVTWQRWANRRSGSARRGETSPQLAEGPPMNATGATGTNRATRRRSRPTRSRW